MIKKVERNYLEINSLEDLRESKSPLNLFSIKISNPSDFQLNKLKLIHLEMAVRGFLFAQRGYLTLNIAMNQDDLKKFLVAFENVLKEHKDILA